jgi:branched-chain amino acid transport system substrate-binding protein
MLYRAEEVRAFLPSKRKRRFSMKRLGEKRMLLLGVVIAVIILGSGAGIGYAQETYKIGVVQPFSGPFALFGEEVYNACQVAADQINAQGGV